MFRYIIYLFVASAALSLFSCKKQKSEPAPTVIDSVVVMPSHNYSALKPGNYWIYQAYTLDSANGAAHAENRFDSAYVEKDTIINNITYHKYVEPGFNVGDKLTSFLRDSLSYIVTHTGHIMFAYDNFSQVFYTYYYYNPAVMYDSVEVTEQMGFKDATTSVNAGNFITSTFRQIWHMPATQPYGPTREYDVVRTKAIGVVRKTRGFYSMTPEIYEWRLERFLVH